LRFPDFSEITQNTVHFARMGCERLPGFAQQAYVLEVRFVQRDWLTAATFVAVCNAVSSGVFVTAFW
jgi:hypothetical protein